MGGYTQIIIKFKKCQSTRTLFSARNEISVYTNNEVDVTSGRSLQSLEKLVKQHIECLVFNIQKNSSVILTSYEISDSKI